MAQVAHVARATRIDRRVKDSSGKPGAERGLATDSLGRRQRPD
jgi:hypothetical protein